MEETKYVVPALWKVFQYLYLFFWTRFHLITRQQPKKPKVVRNTRNNLQQLAEWPRRCVAYLLEPEASHWTPCGFYRCLIIVPLPVCLNRILLAPKRLWQPSFSAEIFLAGFIGARRTAERSGQRLGAAPPPTTAVFTLGRKNLIYYPGTASAAQLMTKHVRRPRVAGYITAHKPLPLHVSRSSPVVLRRKMPLEGTKGRSF